MCRVLHSAVAKGGTLFYGACLQECSLLFQQFCGTLNVSFRQVTRESLRRYGQYLYECGLKPNTISTYMRMLRSIYNRGVEAGIAPYVPRLFHDVYTGVDVRQKKALPAVELHSFCMRTPNRSVCVVHRLLLP